MNDQPLTAWQGIIVAVGALLTAAGTAWVALRASRREARRDTVTEAFNLVDELKEEIERLSRRITDLEAHNRELWVENRKLHQEVDALRRQVNGGTP